MGPAHPMDAIHTLTESVCEKGSVGALASAARHSVGQGVSSWGLRIQWMPSIP